MKNILTIIVLCVISFSAMSQVSQGIKYQGSLRDNAGFVIAGKQIALRLSIVKDSANGASEYIERHSVVSSSLGLFDLVIGTGTVLSGNFLIIDWSQNKKYLKVEVDTANGTSYLLMGTTQFLSVPYANFAYKAASAIVSDSIRYGSIPVGAIMAYGGRNIPNGWLLCDGAEINRIAYAQLFTKIDSVWGRGNGSTTFNLPDLRGQFLRGVNGITNNDLDTATRYARKPGGNVGNKIGSYQDDEFKSHNHTTSSAPTYGGSGAQGPLASGNAFAPPTGYTGGNETRPKNAYVYFIIRCW